MRRVLGFLVLCGCASAPSGDSPLASWNDSEARDAVVDFVERVTTPGPEFVVAAERIAVFDNDGTLWSEQPRYFQMLFAADRVRALAADHPEWRDQQPFKAVLENDREKLAELGEMALIPLLLATHTGMTTTEFEGLVKQWLASARHPRFDRPFTEIVYQPMLELLDYLRANGFKTFIVSGGGVDFMRTWTEAAYGIPPEQVIGSTNVMRVEERDGVPVLVRRPRLEFINDKAGKITSIHKFIGRRPIAAFGNSDGDLQMLQWTAAGEGPRLMAVVHHTDAEREWAYDRESHVGRLDQALDEAHARGWTVIDMREDWARIYPFDQY